MNRRSRVLTGRLGVCLTRPRATKIKKDAPDGGHNGGRGRSRSRGAGAVRETTLLTLFVRWAEGRVVAEARYAGFATAGAGTIAGLLVGMLYARARRETEQVNEHTVGMLSEAFDAVVELQENDSPRASGLSAGREWYDLAL